MLDTERPVSWDLKIVLYGRAGQESVDISAGAVCEKSLCAKLSLEVMILYRLSHDYKTEVWRILSRRLAKQEFYPDGAWSHHIFERTRKPYCRFRVVWSRLPHKAFSICTSSYVVEEVVQERIDDSADASGWIDASLCDDKRPIHSQSRGHEAAVQWQLPVVWCSGIAVVNLIHPSGNLTFYVDTQREPHGQPESRNDGYIHFDASLDRRLEYAWPDRCQQR